MEKGQNSAGPLTGLDSCFDCVSCFIFFSTHASHTWRVLPFTFYLIHAINLFQSAAALRL